MLGRNGSDHLAVAFMSASVIIYIFAIFIPVLRPWLSALSLLLMIYALFRMLSKNVDKRREENYRFVRLWQKQKASLSGARLRHAQSKEYKFFICPACKVRLRIPRGKGRIKITCVKCGRRFDGRS